jgi:hypothetical protein
VADSLTVRKGKKGRSGPPGNLNASKSPWRAFWRRRALKHQDRWVLPILESYSAGLVADKGGADNITAGERRMVEIAQVARGASLLILAEAARRGFVTQVDGSWDLAPGAKELAKFLNVERTAIIALGMGRRAKDVPSLDEIVSELAEADENDAGAAQDVQQRTNESE